MKLLVFFMMAGLLTLISFVVQVGYMMYGWGIEPENWLIIIGAMIWSLFSGALVGLLPQILK